MVPGGRGEERDVLGEPLPRELLDACLIANLATLNADGSIHLVAMWSLWDGEALLLPTSGMTRKARNLERDPRATVMIDDSRGGFDLRGLTLTGRAAIVRGAEALVTNRQIHLKYLTERGRALPTVERYMATDEITIRFTPERASSWDLRSTEQGRAILESGEFRPLADR